MKLIDWLIGRRPADPGTWWQPARPAPPAPDRRGNRLSEWLVGERGEKARYAGVRQVQGNREVREGHVVRRVHPVLRVQRVRVPALKLTELPEMITRNGEL
jgi:hypothetical protein